MANPRINRSTSRLLAAAVLAMLAAAACQGPAESQQTGRVGHGQVAQRTDTLIAGASTAAGSHRA